MTVYCRTSSSPPTTVVWSRDGVKVPVDGVKYETHQSVTNHGYSYYQNVLIVRDIIGIRGSPRYTCSVTNVAGSTLSNVYLHGLPRVTLSLSGESQTIHGMCVYMYMNSVGVYLALCCSCRALPAVL